MPTEGRIVLLLMCCNRGLAVAGTVTDSDTDSENGNEGVLNVGANRGCKETVLRDKHHLAVDLTQSSPRTARNICLPIEEPIKRHLRLNSSIFS